MSKVAVTCASGDEGPGWRFRIRSWCSPFRWPVFSRPTRARKRWLKARSPRKGVSPQGFLARTGHRGARVFLRRHGPVRSCPAKGVRRGVRVAVRGVSAVRAGDAGAGGLQKRSAARSRTVVAFAGAVCALRSFEPEYRIGSDLPSHPGAHRSGAAVAQSTLRSALRGRATHAVASTGARALEHAVRASPDHSLGCAVRPHSGAMVTIRPRPEALGVMRMAPLAPHSSYPLSSCTTSMRTWPSTVSGPA